MAFPSLALLKINDLFFLFLSLLIPLSLASILYLHKRFFSQKSKLPPSPLRLPLIGNLHQLGKVPHHALHKLTEKYGPLVYLKLGQVPALVVSSSNYVREIVKSHDIVFSSRPKTLASGILSGGDDSIAFAPYGDYWRKSRKICVVNLLSHKSVKSFQHVREKEVSVIVERVRKACLSNNGVAIDLSQILFEASNNIVSKCILGTSYQNEDGSLNKLGGFSKKFSTHLLAFSFGDFFPCLKWLDMVSGLVGRLRLLSREYQAFLDHIIQQHKGSSVSESDTEDFVDVLLQIQRDSDSDLQLTQNRLQSIIQDMFGAGTETTSTTTEWIMVELLRNPSTMKKAQEEVRRIVAEKKKLEMDDIDRMDYLKNVVKETLRLHPPAPLLVPRETTAIVKIGPYEIPTKTRVIVNAWAIQRDPNLWDDPEKFIPERFEKDPVDYFSGDDFRFIPFGFGRRICPGLIFGTFSIEYVIANLLYWFDWKYPEENGPVENMDMSEVCGLSVHKKFPLHVVPIRFFP